MKDWKQVYMKKKEWTKIYLGRIFLCLNNNNMKNMRVAFEILIKDLLNNCNDMCVVFVKTCVKSSFVY